MTTPRRTAPARAQRIAGGSVELARSVAVAGEEPLTIRVGGQTWLTTMRTPGDDYDLVFGLLLAERVIRRGADVAALRYCAGGKLSENSFNTLDVELRAGVDPPDGLGHRVVAATAACGVCGRDQIDDLLAGLVTNIAADDAQVSVGLLASAFDAMRTQQRLFDSTGGTHAAGVLNLDSGSLAAVREDIGRHNAVDKVIGSAVRSADQVSAALGGHALLLSVRAGFELVQKAAVAGIPIVASVSAPTSLAVETAEATGITLATWVRDGAATVFSHPRRLVP